MNRRELKGFWSVSAVALAVLVPFASIVYVLQILPDLGIIVYKEQFLALFLALCVAITFLILPPRENVAETSGVPWYDVICALAALAVGGYIFFNYGDLVTPGGPSGQNVARFDEREQRFELVIAILAPLADMQREIDLGVSGFAHGRLPPSRVGVRRHIFG